jgi:ABC-2 type transport system permease protein
LSLGARLSPAGGAVLPAALCLALFAAAFSSLSCALALRTRTQEAMAAFVHLVNLPILFTSTALVPVRHMPDWLAAAARWNPLTLAVDAWRGALLLGQMPSLAAQVLPLAALAAVLYLAAAREMRGIGALY